MASSGPGLDQFASYPPPNQNVYPGPGAPSPARSDTPGSKPRHRRGYQACEACRGRKSKCELGGTVDNPGEPPCERCRRERKVCVFADTRKKRKSSQDSDDLETPAHNRRRLTSTSPQEEFNNQAVPIQLPTIFPSNNFSAQPWNAPSNQASYTSQPRSNQQGIRNELPQRPNMNQANTNTNGVHIRSGLVNDTLHPAAATTQDNLMVLYQAAAETSAVSDHAGQVKSPSTNFGSPITAGSTRPRTFSNNTMTPGISGLIDSTGTTAVHNTGLNQDESFGLALRVWSRMRFVRAGWFTAHEAMQYVEYYYREMAPMTPIVTPDFRPPSKHLALLTEEPILAIAILAITSRHMKLIGPAATSRAYQIHDKLWTYLRCMVERLLWGQEQFGGGFTGGGASAKIRESQAGQITWKGSLRTLGTVEAILLLTDWQPRALHFPPGDDENRLLDADYNLFADHNSDKAEGSDENSGQDSLPYASWLEPAWRSDRMSWMLLGLAQALSFELGVFDKNHYNCRDKHDPSSDCARKRRVRRLVLVYVSQNSGRLGIPSMLPLSQWQNDAKFEQTHHIPGQPEDKVDIMQSCWLEIASIMYKANQEIFPSRQFTRDLTSSDRYITVIADFKPLLKKWKARFEKVSPQIPRLMQHILTMEYEYARCYINSLGLQKVVESWVGKSSVDQALLLKTLSPNREYIEEVADAARTILKTVVDGLAPGNNLRNAPIRTYLRALSGMMFTLKRFGLGGFENEVRQSLELLEKTTDFLANSVVDDVHLSTQTSNLVKLIIANIHKSFIRIQAPTNGSESPSREGSRQQTPHRQDTEHQRYAPTQRVRNNPSSQRVASTRADILAGIPAQTLTEVSNTFMPPPNFNMQVNGIDNSVPVDPNIDMTAFDWNHDWFTLPLDGFLDGSTGTVDQGFGGIGPTVGDRDMLELLTNQHYNQFNGQGATQFNGFH